MFLATGCRRVQDPAPDAHEDIALRMFPLEEWIRLCVEELITPSALATTFRALPHLGYRFARWIKMITDDAGLVDLNDRFGDDPYLH